MTDRRAVLDALVVIGTRPEAIKLAPVVSALHAAPGWRPIVVATGQHGCVVDEVLHAFGITADVGHEPFDRDGELSRLHTVLVDRVAADIARARPHAVVVQGDTASAFAGALAGFFAHVPVVDVEAGLRSGTICAPFPEEGNRRVITRVSSLHLAPTAGAAALAGEGIAGDDVLVTGNTVIDAMGLLQVNPTPPPTRPRVLVTCHRRENWGPPMQHVADALRTVSLAHPDVDIQVVCHPNPAVHRVFAATLDASANVAVTGPLDYLAFLGRLGQATIVVTDSGGVQEEAPAFGVPVLVLREVTERPEGVAGGVARLVGTDMAAIVANLDELLGDPVAYRAMAHATNPYGDGRAARRCGAAMNWHFHDAPRPAAFSARVTSPTLTTTGGHL